MFTMLLYSVLSVANAAPEGMIAVSERGQNLATGEMNQLRSFTPRILSEDPGATRRRTLLLQVEAPWAPIGAFGLEVPEYSWAHVPGDPNNGDPFFYGRQIGVSKEWEIRYPSLEAPRWKDCGDGCLALDVPLKGGYVQRFRVPCFHADPHMRDIWMHNVSSSEVPRAPRNPIRRIGLVNHSITWKSIVGHASKGRTKMRFAAVVFLSVWAAFLPGRAQSIAPNEIAHLFRKPEGVEDRTQAME